MSKQTTLLLTHEYPPMHGGVGGSVRRVAQLLSLSGLEVHVAILKKVRHPIIIGKNISSFVDQSVNVHEIEFSDGTFSADVSQQITVPESDFMAYQGNIECFLSLQFLHKKFHFDVLNGFFLTNVGVLTCLLGKTCGIPSIVSIRGNDIGKNIFLSEHLPALQYILRNADVVTSVSKDLLDAARTIHPFEIGQVISNSFDWKRLEAKRLAEKKDKSLVIGTTGIFRFKKGIPYILEALEGVKFPHDNWSILFAGDFLNSQEKAYHDYFIQKSPFRARIKVTGLFERDEVFTHLAQMDIFIASSFFSEGCPNTVLEAMSMGKAIIGSDAGGIGDLIQHNKNGLVYSQLEFAELTQCLQLLVDSEVLRKNLGEEAKKDLSHFSIDREGSEWAKAYQMALGS